MIMGMNRHDAVMTGSLLAGVYAGAEVLKNIQSMTLAAPEIAKATLFAAEAAGFLALAITQRQANPAFQE